MIEVLLGITVACAPSLKFFIRHSVDRYSESQRGSNSEKQLTGSTAYTNSSDGTLVDDEDTDMGFFDAISTPAEKMRARSLMKDFGFPSAATPLKAVTPPTLSDFHENMLQWQRNRSPSVQEEELIMAGILSPDPEKTFGYFDRERRCMVTDDPRPVLYPWVDTSPPAEKESGPTYS